MGLPFFEALVAFLHREPGVAREQLFHRFYGGTIIEGFFLQHEVEEPEDTMRLDFSASSSVRKRLFTGQEDGIAFNGEVENGTIFQAKAGRLGGFECE